DRARRGACGAQVSLARWRCGWLSRNELASAVRARGHARGAGTMGNSLMERREAAEARPESMDEQVRSTPRQQFHTLESRRLRRATSWKTALVASAAAIAVLWLGPSFPASGVRNAEAAARDSMPTLSFVAQVAREALGRSGNVHMETALPGSSVNYPLLVGGEVAGLFYQWVGVSDSVPIGPILPLGGAELRAPDEPGLYRLTLM